MLPFPLVRVHPDGVAVGAMELRVDVEQRLHVVVAGGDMRDVFKRKSENARADGGSGAGVPRVDIHTIEGDAAAIAAGLEARFACIGATEDDEKAAGRGGGRGGREG